MKHSESLFLDIRGLRYHVRHWKGNADKKIFLLHGWMDVSASFQFLVDALHERLGRLRARTGAATASPPGPARTTTGFPDYIGDLDALLDRIQPEAPVNLVGHSLGGNVGGLYAGIRPERVARFVNLEGFGMPATRPEQAPKRYARWMDELQDHAALAALRELRGARGPAAEEQSAPDARARRVPRAPLGQGRGGRRRGPAQRSGAQAGERHALPAGRGARLLGAVTRAGAVGGRRAIRRPWRA